VVDRTPLAYFSYGTTIEKCLKFVYVTRVPETIIIYIFKIVNKKINFNVIDVFTHLYKECGFLKREYLLYMYAFPGARRF